MPSAAAVELKTKTKNQVENWKKQLIDFSRKNQLLFFRPRASLTIEIQETARDIFAKMVIQNKSLGFQEQENSAVLSMEAVPEEDDFAFEEVPALNIPSVEDLDLANLLLTNKDSTSLEQILSKLKLRSQASMQEQGVNILYLALYFLNWQDTENESASSPLILLPVSLSRKGLNGAFRLSLMDDEICLNPTLTYKLERDYGIKLSELESRFDEIDSVEGFDLLINDLQSLITKDHKNWELVDKSCLSLFSFAKLALYKDIETNEAKILAHPVVKQIAGELLDEAYINQKVDPRYWVSSKEIDRKINGNESAQILDADSSQEEAIYAAKAGRSFVIQGPPGTGKSQTIANIITEALSQGKKVLFVSEKKSALDVVVKRLTESRLDRFCLELHNAQRKKADVISELRTSLEEIKLMAVETTRDEYIDSVNELKSQIQSAIEELHKIREPIHKSLYEIYGEIAYLGIEISKQNSALSPIDFSISNLEKLDLKALSQLNDLFMKLASHSEILENYDSYIWKDAQVLNLSFEVENDIKANLISLRNLIRELPTCSNPLAKRYFDKEVNNLHEFKWLAEATRLAMNSPFPRKDWLNPARIQEVESIAVQAQFLYQDYRSSKKEILSSYDESFLELDHEVLIDKFSTRFTSVFRFLDLDYWKSVSQIKKLAFEKSSKDLKAMMRDLEFALELDSKQKDLESESAQLSLALGEFYKEFETDWDETRTAIRWVQKILNKFETSQLPSSLVTVITDASSDSDRESFNEYGKVLLAKYDQLKTHLEFYKSIFPNSGLDIDFLSFDDLIKHVDELARNIHKIESWIEFQSYVSEAESLGAKQFLDSILKAKLQNLSGPLLQNIFLNKFYQAWVDKIEIENPEIRKFSGNGQSLLVDRFNKADLQIQSSNRKLISKKLASSWIDYAADPNNKADLQLIGHELNKKKKHKPIRLILQEVPKLIQTLKPCWMMSPLTVSRLIDSGSASTQLEFDLVIFDEASQIKTEDAICSIYRGKQLILAGDSNQLPPTNFFNYIDNDDDYESHSFESVLDECSVFLESKTLNWHYRSRHEDLIKFSNYHIYENQLISFPSPINQSQDFGVHFELIQDGYYERGSRFNRKEAARVAEAILEHYSSSSNLSLGVIAFSEAQQFAIERELAKLLKKYPDLDQSFLDEDQPNSLFIKNLENVQGDERDIIFFSIGYARDRKGVLSHNFGPLNREGGHRRLNVAITRARNKLKVFSSIVSSDIDSSRSSAQGLLLLKKYLAFAENPSSYSDFIEEASIRQKATNSRIEGSIAAALEAKGYKTELYLGASEYKIDIAVKDENDKYLLAIETDGEMYRSAHTARDRERLRKAVLQSLGWQTHKIWARDWIRNQEQELNKVLELIKHC